MSICGWKKVRYWGSYMLHDVGGSFMAGSARVPGPQVFVGRRTVNQIVTTDWCLQ